ncbi:MAG: transcription elongation factor GreA [Deltaproteobacteria bacterium]|nr:transcription elongation factor GreA [Deltaproteobacteria bacterium]
MEKEPITPEGYRRLREEIKKIKSLDRPAVIVAIAEARAHGDLKENAEYHAAKEKQGLLEAKLRDLEHLLATAEIIDYRNNACEKVTFGSTVLIENLDTGEEKKYQIVGKFELNLKENKIPISSPLAKSLIGKQKGEEISLNAPKGVQTFSIVSIDYI